MKMTLNLYSKDSCASEEILRRYALSKNPIIFLIRAGEKPANSVFSLMNMADYVGRSMLIIKDYDEIRVVSYLSSFKDIETRKVLLVMPGYDKEKSTRFAEDIIMCIRRVTLRNSIKIRR